MVARQPASPCRVQIVCLPSPRVDGSPTGIGINWQYYRLNSFGDSGPTSKSVVSDRMVIDLTMKMVSSVVAKSLAIPCNGITQYLAELQVSFRILSAMLGIVYGIVQNAWATIICLVYTFSKLLFVILVCIFESKPCTSLYTWVFVTGQVQCIW